ncbi:TAM domain methyltransferase [Pleurostoma richardsiae]|uniref:TAM domain methyltransferase n=1 Tax=Pleurostoma richardsiae TaxID=41990 RepID=A0AA38RDJ9_9PEZI|nr:TAM domain methyltransferase [Pleurostoma richardsiae]
MDTAKKRGQKGSGGGQAVDPQPQLGKTPTKATSASTLTASLSSDYPHSTSTDSGQQGPGPGTPSSRKQSGAWDRRQLQQLQQQRSAGTGTADDDDRSDEDSIAPDIIWPRSESDDSDDPAPSSRASERGKSKGGGSKPGFFRSLAQKFSKNFKRYGFIPNDQQEQNRNIIQHQVIQELFEGRCHLAPVVRPRSVLDVGTGPGTWASEYAQRHPNSHVLGIDIERVRPAHKVSNCQFLIMDATEEWTIDSKFDFIHVRMLGDVPGKSQLVQSIYDHLNPGGWVEFTEWIVLLQSPNHSFDGTAFHKWNLTTGLDKLGSSLYYPKEYKSLLRKAGFERITETKNAAPTNACYPGKRIEKVGSLMTANWNAIIEPLTMPVFTGALGWTQEQVKSFLVDVRKEIGDTRYHSFMTLMTIYGRKPKDKDGSSSTSASISSVQISQSGTTATSSSTNT